MQHFSLSHHSHNDLLRQKISLFLQPNSLSDNLYEVSERQFKSKRVQISP